MTVCKFRNILLALAVLFVDFTNATEMHLTGSSYIKFDMIANQNEPPLRPVTTETLFLRFKTVHPSGLLFYAHGTTGQYISLELVQGKLRYTLKLGGLSNEKPYSLTFADELCDNVWHSVRVIRDRHRLYLHFDGNQKTVVIGDPRYGNRDTLLLNFAYYVGGTWKTANEYGSALAKNFAGCLSDVLFNAFHPISELQRDTTGYETEGNVTFRCLPTSYEPITFTSDKAVLGIPSEHARHEVSTSFAFRSYDRDGVLMFRDGNKASVHLYLKDAKLKFEFQVGFKAPVTIDTSSFIKDLNDGAWHIVKASVDVHFMYLEVDDYGGDNISAHAVELYGSTSLDFENVTYIGGGTYYGGMHGFVGCMRDLRANGQTIDLKGLTIPRGIYSQFVVRGRCALRSFCHPTPCQHHSICVQKSSNFTCECKRFFEGRYCEQPLFQATCQRYKELGMRKDAYCTVDPDSGGPLAEFRVLCNMTAGPNAVAVVNHTRGDGTVRVRDADRFSPVSKIWIHFIDYGVDYTALRALVDESDHCRQYVQFDCINTTFLMRQPNGRPGAVWASTDAISRYYWGGGRDTNSECACAQTSSCHERQKVCNCDTGDGVWRRDAGYITKKSHLPIVRIFFPAAAKSSNFTLGSLECFGARKRLTRETGERKYFGIACQPLASTPPPVYPWRTKATVKPSMKATVKSSTESTTSKLTQTSAHSPTTSSDDHVVFTTLSNGKISDSRPSQSVHRPTLMSSKNNSLLPVDSTGHIRVDLVDQTKKGRGEKKNPKWIFIVVIAGSSLFVFLALFFLLVIVRHKRANGVWCTGLFMFSSCVKQQQLPKIEIYRHSMGTDSPDILHLEDFKNTKVVDLHIHRGRLVSKYTPKKMVTFKDEC